MRDHTDTKCIHLQFQHGTYNFFSTRNRREIKFQQRLLGLRKTMVDRYAGRTITATQELKLEPYQLLVLSRSV